jgi:hypothetical protein
MPMRPFGPWAPDQSAQLDTPHLRDASGVIPAANDCYEPFASLEAISEALGSQCKGAVSTRDQAGDVHTFAGTITGLFELESDGSWTDVTNTGGAYTDIGDDGRWRFAKYGDNLIATNNVDAIQTFAMSSDSNFSDLSGASHTAKFVAEHAGFVFTANTDASPFQLKWSGQNDSTEWTPGTALSDEIDFPDGGQITGLASDDVLHVFQERSIRRAYFTGSAIIPFDIQVVEYGRGCAAPGSLAQLGRRKYFLDEDGFYEKLGEAESTPISAEIVDEWFKNDSNRAYFPRMSSAIDPFHKVVVWSYVSTSSQNGAPDSLILFNWVARRWARVRISNDQLMQSISLGYTLEDLDALYSSIDDMTISLDDEVWIGGALALAAFNAGFQLSRFGGAAVEAQLLMGAVKPNMAGRAFIRSALPIVDTASATMAVAAGERPAARPEDLAFPTEQAIQASGRCPLRGSGRYFYPRLTIPAATDWKHAIGVDEFEFEADGDQ